jgi:hypothetical protein
MKNCVIEIVESPLLLFLSKQDLEIITEAIKMRRHITPLSESDSKDIGKIIADICRRWTKTGEEYGISSSVI